MQCPHCRDEVLIAIEYESVEVDYCVGCKGVWLDAGEIELLLGDADATAAYLSIGSPCGVPAGEKPRKCPECGKVMTKEGTESTPPVIFDHCPKGHGMWLDHSELETMLKHMNENGTPTEVGRYLNDIFDSKET